MQVLKYQGTTTIDTIGAIKKILFISFNLMH